MKLSILTTASLGILAMATIAHADETINFDDVVTSNRYVDVTPGGALGPVLTYPGITLNGGAIIRDGEVTSQPNGYGSTDFIHLADGSSLPGFETGTFSTPGEFSAVALDIINGNVAGTFTLSAYDSSNDLISSSQVSLDSYRASGDKANVTVSGPNISYFTVTSGQGAGQIDFLIDNVVLTSAPTPEPGSVTLLAGLGFAGAALLWGKRRVR